MHCNWLNKTSQDRVFEMPSICFYCDRCICANDLVVETSEGPVGPIELVRGNAIANVQGWRRY